MPDDLRGLRLLIVEDEPLVALTLQEFVEDWGCIAVGPAMTVESAVGLATTAEIDGAMIDLNLQGERTDDVVTALQARAIPFLILTGYGSVADPYATAAPVVRKPALERELFDMLCLVLVGTSPKCDRRAAKAGTPPAESPS
jgi:ActR/RegA family two-component response regulator